MMRLLLTAVLLLTYGSSRGHAVTDSSTEATPSLRTTTPGVRITPTVPGPTGSINIVTIVAGVSNMTVYWIDRLLPSPSFAYRVQALYTGPCNTSFNLTSPLLAPETSVFEFVSGELHPNSQYSVSVLRFYPGAGSAASAESSQPYAVSTRPSAPTIPPLNLRVVVEAEDVITIAWDPIPCLFRNSPVSYQVDVAIGTSVSSVVQSERYTLHAPTPDTLYFFTVHGQYNGLLSPPSEIIPVISATVACHATRCHNRGLCPVQAGNCSCFLGFSGTHCETDLDFCTSTSCQNNATCVEGIGFTTSCSCPPGFTGKLCSTDMDYCTDTTCKNNGTCVEGVGELVSCMCPSGVTGANCELDLLSCDHKDPCHNGGICTEAEEVGGLLTCLCPMGYEGVSCEVDADYCTPTTCLNGGLCFELPGALTSCQCLPGYEGDRCLTDLDFCETAPSCVNGGTCLEGRGTTTICACPPGFTGNLCQEDIDYCTASTCRNGAICVEGAGRATSCLCTPEFTGPMCSVSLGAGEEVPCPARMDTEWGLTFLETLPGVVVRHMCSEIRQTDDTRTLSGVVTTVCLGNGEWGEVDVFDCRQEEFQQISMQAQMTFSQGEVESSQVEDVLRELVVATEVDSTDTPSQFPQDLEATNSILGMTLDYFASDLMENPENPAPLSTRVVEVIDNILEPNNEPGWEAFGENEVGSEAILTNAESYGQYFAQALMNTNINVEDESIRKTMSISKENIVVAAQMVEGESSNSINFPENLDPNQQTQFGDGQSILSRPFLLDRGAAELSLSAINIRLDNIDKFLPRGENSTTQPATSVISTQLILAMNFITDNSTTTDVPDNSMTTETPLDDDNMMLSNKSATQSPDDDVSATDEDYDLIKDKDDVITTRPTITGDNSIATFRFTTNRFENGMEVRNPQCAFWKISDDGAGGFWSHEGMVTEIASYNEEEKTYDVVCQSTHLTSFAVLLDVNNALSETESNILTIITYIGCSISIVCLIVTIIFFIVVIGKAMFTSVHYFIHLNLAIALLLGYVVFLAGVDTAVGNRVRREL